MTELTYSNVFAEMPLDPIEPHDPRYDGARRAYNLHADLRPAAIVSVRTPDEVQAAVRYAIGAGLRVAPFVSGHMATAMPDLGDALMLRLERGEQPIDVDVAANIVRVPAGARWQDVVDEVSPYSLTVPHGSAPDIGVAGYLLGGGLSFYGREHGLATNLVTAIELVCADGELRRTSADEHPELFWALRGGGGNFGVVTEIEVEMLPYATVFAGGIYFPIEHARAVLREWTAWTRIAPASVTTAARLLRLPPSPEVPEPLRGRPIVGIDGIAVDDDAGAALVHRLTAVAPPVLDTWSPMPAPAALRIHGDPEQPLPVISGHALLAELDGDAIDSLLAVAGADAATPLAVVELRQLGAELSTPPPGAGARGALDGRFALFACGVPTGPAHATAVDAACSELLAALSPWDTGRVYGNFDERAGAARAGFDAATYRRLVEIRGQWDPRQLFVPAHGIA